MEEHRRVKIHNKLSALCKSTGASDTVDASCHHVLGALMEGMRTGRMLSKYANRDYSMLLQEVGLSRHASDEMARLLRDYNDHLHSAVGLKP